MRRRPTRRRRSGAGAWRWDECSLQTALEAFTADRAVFPTRAEFDAANRGDLRCAVSDHGGSAYWAERLGLPLSPRQDKSPYTDSDAVREARALMAVYGRLFGVRKLRAMGHARLATAVQAAGGSRRFISRAGIDNEPANETIPHPSDGGVDGSPAA